MVKNSGFKWAKVLDISGAHLLHDIYSAFLAPLYPLLIEKLGLNYVMIGGLTVIQRIASLFNPLIGLMVDRRDLRYFIILTPAITAISMSLIGLAQSFWQLAFLLFIMGWSAAFFHVPGPVLIKRVSGDRAGMGMSFYMLAGELARSLGPIIIVSAISWWGLEGTYKLIPAGLIASIILFFRLRKLKHIEVKTKKIDISIKELLVELKGFYFAVTGYTFARGLMKSLLVTFLPAYYVSKGETLWVAAYTLSILQFAGAIGSLVAGSYSDKIGRRNSLIIISIITPVLMLVFLLVSGWLKIIVLSFIGVCLFGSSPVLLAMVQEMSSDRPSFNNGIFMTISFAFGAFATMLVGILADSIGLEQSFYLAPIFALLAIPFAFRLGKEKK
jgi:FSR family fosmidomycin resistance protein-like MFS transporter